MEPGVDRGKVSLFLDRNGGSYIYVMSKRKKTTIKTFYPTIVIFNNRKYRSVFHRSVIVIEPGNEKTNVLVSDLVRHKSGCTATEDG